MATWNELYSNEENIPTMPQLEVYIYLKKLESFYNKKPLLIWDQCCGAGRHTVFMVKSGFNVYASDISKNGIEYLRKWLSKEKLKAKLIEKQQ